MRKLVSRLIPWLILIGIIAIVYPAFSHDGLRLTQRNHAVVSQSHYKDEYVEVKVASAEGQYVIKVTALIPEVNVEYIGSKNVDELKNFTAYFDQVKISDIQTRKIRVKNSGLLQKEIRLIEFSVLHNIPAYSNIAAARQALSQIEIDK